MWHKEADIWTYYRSASASNEARNGQERASLYGKFIRNDSTPNNMTAKPGRGSLRPPRLPLSPPCCPVLPPLALRTRLLMLDTTRLRRPSMNASKSSAA